MTPSEMRRIMAQVGILAEAANLEGEQGLDYLSVQMSNSTPPKSIEYRLDGKFHRVLKRSWT